MLRQRARYNQANVICNKTSKCETDRIRKRNIFRHIEPKNLSRRKLNNNSNSNNNKKQTKNNGKTNKLKNRNIDKSSI